MSKKRIRPRLKQRFLVEASYDFTGRGRVILCDLCYHKRIMQEAPRTWKPRGKHVISKDPKWHIHSWRVNHEYPSPMLRVHERVKPYEKVHCMRCGYPQKRL